MSWASYAPDHIHLMFRSYRSRLLFNLFCTAKGTPSDTHHTNGFSSHTAPLFVSFCLLRHLCNNSASAYIYFSSASHRSDPYSSFFCTSSLSSALSFELYLHGAAITQWLRPDGQPALNFDPRNMSFDTKRPIRCVRHADVSALC